jgi:hypothetical protein
VWNDVWQEREVWKERIDCLGEEFVVWRVSKVWRMLVEFRVSVYG